MTIAIRPPAPGIMLNEPFHLVVGAGGEGGALQHLPHFFSAETKVVDGPHVGKLHDFNL